MLHQWNLHEADPQKRYVTVTYYLGTAMWLRAHSMCAHAAGFYLRLCFIVPCVPVTKKQLNITAQGAAKQRIVEKMLSKEETKEEELSRLHYQVKYICNKPN